MKPAKWKRTIYLREHGMECLRYLLVRQMALTGRSDVSAILEKSLAYYARYILRQSRREEKEKKLTSSEES